MVLDLIPKNFIKVLNIAAAAAQAGKARVPRLSISAPVAVLVTALQEGKCHAWESLNLASKLCIRSVRGVGS